MLDQHSLIAQNLNFGNQGQDRTSTPAPRICLFDADARWCDVVAQMLQQSGYCVTASKWTDAALAALAGESYDLIILNLESGKPNSAQILQHLRQAYRDIPLIVTTAHASAESAIAAVKANVVDYIVKPYEPSDLLMTVSKALEERAKQLRHQQLVSMVSEALTALQASQVAETKTNVMPADLPSRMAQVLSAGEVELDREKRQLIWKAEPARSIELTESELTIMVTLMEKPNQVVSCNTLGSALGYQQMDKWTIENVIRSVVFRLRQKLEADSEGSRLIHTVRGRGYYFAPG